MKKEEKVELLRKAQKQGIEIDITQQYTMSGELLPEAVEGDIDPDKLDEPINWDLDEVIDIAPCGTSALYTVNNYSNFPEVKRNLTQDELYDYLKQITAENVSVEDQYINAYDKVIHKLNNKDLYENFIADMLSSRTYDMVDNVCPKEEIGKGLTWENENDYYQTLKSESTPEAIANAIINSYLVILQNKKDISNLIPDGACDNHNLSPNDTPVNDEIDEYYFSLSGKLMDNPQLSQSYDLLYDLSNRAYIRNLLTKLNLPVPFVY